jgi:hypothetical protein
VTPSLRGMVDTNALLAATFALISQFHTVVQVPRSRFRQVARISPSSLWAAQYVQSMFSCYAGTARPITLRMGRLYAIEPPTRTKPYRISIDFKVHRDPEAQFERGLCVGVKVVEGLITPGSSSVTGRRK